VRRLWPFKADRIDKAVALVVGVALLIAILWVLVQFFLGFLAGLFGV
jgi:FlaG/FlaF family flagellin (archaellin)